MPASLQTILLKRFGWSYLALWLAACHATAWADCKQPEWLDQTASNGHRWLPPCPDASLDGGNMRLQLGTNAYIELTGATQPATRLRCENDGNRPLTLLLRPAKPGTPWQPRISVSKLVCHWQDTGLRCPALSRWPVCVVESQKIQASVLSMNASVQVKSLYSIEPDDAERLWLSERQVAMDFCQMRFAPADSGELTIEFPARGRSDSLQLGWQPAAKQNEARALLSCLEARLPQGGALPETGRMLRIPWLFAKP